MNKADLVSALAEKTGATKKAAEASLDALTETITDALKKGEKITLVGFGSFEVKKRAARKGRNPQTGKTISIPAKKVVKFKAGTELSNAVN